MKDLALSAFIKQGSFMNFLFSKSKKTTAETIQIAMTEHYSSLYRIAFAWSGNCHESQDLVQETFLKALERFDSLKEPEKSKQWLIVIMRNCYLDDMRYKKRWQITDEGALDTMLFSTQSSEQLVIEQQKNDQLQMAIQKLPFEQKETLLLADLEGFSYQEISSITDTPIGTVMSRLSRAREKLRERLLQNSIHPSSQKKQKIIPFKQNHA